MATMISIQDSYVTRVLLAHSKITPRTRGNRFARSVRAARREAMDRLMRQGFRQEDAKVIVKDAHDVALLEAYATVD